jgi:hypothetical protein
MAESEKKDGQVPEAQPIAADAKELTDENLEQVAGGMAASVPHIDQASSLSSLAKPVCLSQT